MSEINLTVVLSNYNHGRFLCAALDGILLQSRPADEVIVIDDCSTDDSVDILRSYERRFSTLRVIVNERNLGIHLNAQTLLALARGRYHYSAAADDYLLPTFLEESLRILERFPEAGLCSTQSHIIDEGGAHRGYIAPNPRSGSSDAYFISPPEAAEQLFRRGSWMQGNTAVFRRAALVAAGGFRRELGPYCDGFLHEVLALSHGVCFVPRPLAVWRRAAGTHSNRTTSDFRRQIRNAAIHRMRGEYVALFSQSYIRRWRRRWDAGSLLSVSAVLAAEWRREAAESLSGTGLLARVCVWPSQLMIGAALGATSLTAGVLRWFDLGWVLRGALHRWWQKRFEQTPRGWQSTISRTTTKGNVR